MGRAAGGPIFLGGGVNEALSDTPSGLGYGYMWWHLPSVLGLGGDGFAALGARGQAVLVIPSKRLVVTQTGDRTDSLIDLTASHLFELVRLIVAASPSKTTF